MAKFGVEEWADGTATYYWLLDSDFGVAPFLRAPIEAIVGVGAGVLLLTWGTLLVEILLALGLLARNSVRRQLFWLGVGFHAAIGILMGLVSFALAMAGALLLHLWPPEHPLPGASLASLYRRANAGPTVARPEAVT